MSEIEFSPRAGRISTFMRQTTFCSAGLPLPLCFSFLFHFVDCTVKSRARGCHFRVRDLTPHAETNNGQTADTRVSLRETLSSRMKTTTTTMRRTRLIVTRGNVSAVHSIDSQIWEIRASERASLRSAPLGSRRTRALFREQPLAEVPEAASAPASPSGTRLHVFPHTKDIAK